MKANEIVVGEIYLAKVSGQLVRVRVDDIAENPGRKIVSHCGLGINIVKRIIRANTRYACTNLSTGRIVIFRSAMKFRCKAVVGSKHVDSVLNPCIVDAMKE